MSAPETVSPNEILLALDTSGPRLQLALIIKGQTYCFCEQILKGHAEILFERLQDLLNQYAITYQDLSKIAVTTGPGSFTGLRIGIAAARGLGLALNIPVIGIPNLLALSLSKTEENFAIIVDARRNQFYRQDFDGPGMPTGAPQLVEKSDLSELDILTDPEIDMALLAQFAMDVVAKNYPPAPTYVRAADAKPQTKLRVARL